MALSNKQPCHSDVLLTLYYSCFYDCFPDSARIRLTCSSQVNLTKRVGHRAKPLRTLGSISCFSRTNVQSSSAEIDWYNTTLL